MVCRLSDDTQAVSLPWTMVIRHEPLPQCVRLEQNASSLARLSGGDAGIQTSAGELEGFSKDLLNIAHLEGEAATVQMQTNAGRLSRSAYSRMPTSIEDGLIGEAGFSKLRSIPQSSHSVKLNTYGPSKCYTSDHSRKNSINVPSIDSRHYNLDRDKPRITSHVQPGNLRISSPTVEGTRTEVAKIGSFTSSVQPAGQFHAFHSISPIEAPRTYISPERIGLQFSKGSSYQSDVAAVFLRDWGFNLICYCSTTRG
ncbi:hypothetical protein SASPL_155696 [Salvia splendens]|uniref:Uncharacterized protein n=1 Tax=Salvia splendens TaxID=180675 RepID=A0A8X8VY04_SALSN|nr:hypothetical protein SASPL_155696 [Salvia splendens]